MPEQRKRLHCVAEITLSTTFLLASEVPAIAAFARSGLPQERNFKKRKRGTNAFASLAHALWSCAFAKKYRDSIDRLGETTGKPAA